MRTISGLLSVCLLTGIFVCSSFDSVAQSRTPLRGRLSLPAKNWGVVLELPGFTVTNVKTMPGDRRYMLATNAANGMAVSLTLEQLAPGQKAAPCRDSLKQKAENPPTKVNDVMYSRSGDVEAMQYTVPEMMGQRFMQKNLFACEFYDNVYIDLHISKVSYTAADDPVFAAVLNSMHVDRTQKSSRELMEEGSRYYVQKDYEDAISRFAQALDLEKTSPSLGRPLWYVLVDNLGMSYGITGDLARAKETFDYGLSKDPSYPLFYYNLACTYAEMNDAANATAYLKKAFEHKANTLPGETMPDPRTDDSFRELMKNKDFHDLAESLAR